MQFDVERLLPWVQEQLDAGQSYDALVWHLALSDGYALHIAHRIVEACVQYGGNNGQLFDQAPNTRIACPQPRFTSLGTQGVLGQPVTLSFLGLHPRIAFFDNVATPAECAALIACSRQRLEKSRLALKDEVVLDLAVRTSSTALLVDSEENITARLRQRLAFLATWPLSHCESLQVQHYQVGQQYVAHNDFFSPSKHEGAAHLRNRGNRLASFILYLNEPERGGGTYFAGLGMEFRPRQGSALFFSYPEKSESSLTLHAGRPVEAGEKWIATLWMRERAAQVEATPEVRRAV